MAGMKRIEFRNDTGHATLCGRLTIFCIWYLADLDHIGSFILISS